MIHLTLPVSANALVRLLVSLLLIEGYALWRKRHAKSFWMACLLLLCALTALCLLLLPLA